MVSGNAYNGLENKHMTIIKHNPASLFPQYKNYSHGVEVTANSRMLFVSGLNGYLQDGRAMPESFEAQSE